MKFLRTCREVAALVSEREDRTLATTERTVIRAHAFICRRCTKWEAQVSFMRKSMRAWGNYKD